VLPALGVAAVSFALFDFSSRTFPTTDSAYQNLPAQTLVNYGTPELGRLRDALRENGLGNLAIENDAGRLFSKTGVLGGILSAPFFMAANRWYGLPQLSPRQILSEYTQSIGKSCGAFFCAVSAALLFAVLGTLFPPAAAWLGCATYVLCTSVFNIASQANWQHGLSLALITASLLLALGAGTPGRVSAVASGVLLGIAMLLRISNACYVPFFALALLRCEPSFDANAPVVAAGGTWLVGLTASALVGLPSPYAGEIVLSLRGLSTWYPPLNAATLLFSPNSGFFVFSPALLPAIAAPFLAARSGSPDRGARVVGYFVPVMLAFVALASIWWIPTGGPLAGRLLIEALPAFAVWLAFAAHAFGRARWFRAAFAVLAAWSLGVNVLTTYFFDFGWYFTPQIRRIEARECLVLQSRDCVILHYRNHNEIGWASSPLLLEYLMRHPVFQGIWRLQRTERGVERVEITTGRTAPGLEL